MGNGTSSDRSGTNTRQNQQLRGQETDIGSIEQTNLQQMLGTVANAATNAANAQILNKFDHLLTSPPNTCPVNNTVGPNQWLRIYVPSKHTKLTMGQQDLGSSTHDIENGERHHYTGFSVTTEGHIFASVGGRMGIESKGPLIIQSTEASTYFASPGATCFGSQGGIVLASPGGVVIHGGGGFGVGVPVADSRNARTPDLPDELNEAGALSDKIGSLWGNWDGIVASVVVAKGLCTSMLAMCEPNTAYAAAVVAGLGSIRDIGWASIAFGGDPWKGACVHGERGVICTTNLGGFGSVFAASGFMVGSAASIFMGAQYSELCGIVSASLESRRLVSLDSDDKLEVVGKKKLQLSAREGDLRVDAHHIAVGGGPHGPVQKGTNNIAISAQRVALESSDLFHIGSSKTVSIGGNDVTLKGAKKAICTSKTHFLAHVGPSHIRLTGSEAFFGVGESAGDVPDVPDVPLGWAQLGYYNFKTDNQREYATKLSGHIEKVKKFKGGWTQIHFTSKNCEIKVQGNCVADCTGSNWDFDKNTSAKK